MLVFFIAGLLYLLRFERVDNVGAYGIRSETGQMAARMGSGWRSRYSTTDRLSGTTARLAGVWAETAVFLDSGFAVVVLTNDQDADPDAVVLKIMGAVCNSSQLARNC